MNKITRRRFVKSAAAVAGGICTAALSGGVAILAAPAKKSDVRIERIAYKFEEHTFRAPLKFAQTVVDRATLLTVTCTVRTAAGQSATDIDAPGFDDRTGFGLLDLPAALVAATPPADTPEPNDDIDEIAAHRLFSTAQPAISTPHAANTRFAATLDLAEDPDDVYRVVLPARKKLTVVLTPSANVSLDLWSSAAGSVAGIAGRLARSNRPGSAGERVVFVNRKPERRARSRAGRVRQPQQEARTHALRPDPHD